MHASVRSYRASELYAYTPARVRSSGAAYEPFERTGPRVYAVRRNGLVPVVRAAEAVIAEEKRTSRTERESYRRNEPDRPGAVDWARFHARNARPESGVSVEFVLKIATV